jgi:hypothetical protein
MMSAAKMHMAETVAAMSMAAAVTSSMTATVTSSMAATMTSAAAVTAAPGYRATRERHRKDNERNSN